MLSVAMHLPIDELPLILATIRPLEQSVTRLLPIYKVPRVNAPIFIALLPQAVRLVVQPIAGVLHLVVSVDQSSVTVGLRVAYLASIIRSISVDYDTIVAICDPVLEVSLEVCSVVVVGLSLTVGDAIFPLPIIAFLHVL